MILNRFFRKTPARERVVYEAIVAAARHPVPYENWGVADDVDGRFDMLSLHMFLALNRLKGEADQFRQNLVDEFFADMDRSLREMGVGDISVGKKVRKMAEAFYGRVAAYDAALGQGKSSLVAALARNFFPAGGETDHAAKLADYTFAASSLLAKTTTDSLTAGRIVFPEPRR